MNQPQRTASASRIINSLAPIRINDLGGWTDTWFARFGKVLNMAVYPFAEVQMRVYARHENRPPITIYAENYGERYTLEGVGGTYDRHPLLEAALQFMGIPDELALEIDIFCEAPAGASTGTSAAVSVALIGALDLLTPGRLTPHEVARAAHRIETELLHQQCGVQDQLASAYGGVNFIEILEYPHAIVSPLALAPVILWELETRLSLIFLGQSHSSSKVHERVIAELEDAGPEAEKLRPLRETPTRARDALYAGDFGALGRSMIDNTDAQAALHPDLVSAAHQAVIDVARRHGAVGWKVNGAGGDGGSVTLLGGAEAARNREMLEAITAEVPLTQNIPVYLNFTGLKVWETSADAVHPGGGR
ncbi:MAG: GHMP family kinase ATP-binding protein [Thermoguttaceae bacterium]